MPHLQLCALHPAFHVCFDTIYLCCLLPCAQANARNPRFGLNWAKLHAWQWTDYDALIMLDADMVVLVRARSGSCLLGITSP